MIDQELQAFVLNGPAGVLAVLGASLLAAVFAVAVFVVVVLVRVARIQRLMTVEFAALNGRLAAAEAQAAAHADALRAAMPVPEPPAPEPPALDAADVMALTEAVRSVSAAVARIDRQMGDARLQIRTLQADTGTRLDQAVDEMRAALSGSGRLVAEVLAKALAAAPAAPAMPAPPPVPPPGGGEVPRERVPEPFRRPVPRHTG